MPADVFAGTIIYGRGRDSSFNETPTGGWEDATTQPLRVLEVPGDHVTLWTEPDMGLWARQLRAVITEAQVS